MQSSFAELGDIVSYKKLIMSTLNYWKKPKLPSCFIRRSRKNMEPEAHQNYCSRVRCMSRFCTTGYDKNHFMKKHLLLSFQDAQKLEVKEKAWVHNHGIYIVQS